MKKINNKSFLALILSSFIPVFFAFLSAIDGHPSLWSPLSLPSFIVVMFGMSVFEEIAGMLFGILIILIIFITLNLFLLKESNTKKVPKTLTFILAIFSILSLLSIITSWNYGIEYQGKAHTVGILLINILIISLMWTLWFFIRKNCNFKKLLILSVVFYSWIFWSAFPWLGEMGL